MGVLLGRWLARTQSHMFLSPASSAVAPPTPNYRPKLAREDVVRLIKDNGGSEGLNLSAYDLSGLDLRRLKLIGVTFSTYIIGGGAYETAHLADTDFSGADLTRANFSLTELERARFRNATLYEATFVAARANKALFLGTDLRRVNFYGCELSDASLQQVDLRDANLNAAIIADALITEARLGEYLIQEKEETYRDYFDSWYLRDLPAKARERHLSTRYAQAAEIYMNLKNAYLSYGRYREASWAYLKERRMRRATLVPWRAGSYYGEALAQNAGFLGWRRSWLYLKYTCLWFFDWLNDTTSGYGERPLRTLWLALVVIILFPLFYRWSGQIVLQSGETLQWIDYFIFSLGAFTTMDFGRFGTTGWLAETIASIEALLGISILALLMFALGNRISRS